MCDPFNPFSFQTISLPLWMQLATSLLHTSSQARNNTTIVETSKRLRSFRTSIKMAAQYVPTAEMPLMKGIRADLVQALDEKKSLFEVTLMLGDVVKDLEKVGTKVDIKATVESFNEGVPMMQMASLLHYVNVKLLRSIIAGTLAYDLHQDPDLGANCQYNDSCSAGTYVVSLSIKGRQGKFLSMRELSRLALEVGEYADGAELWIKNKKAWDDQDLKHIQAMKFIKVVDNKAGRADPAGKPRFADNAGAVEKLKELQCMFRRRAIVISRTMAILGRSRHR